MFHPTSERDKILSLDYNCQIVLSGISEYHFTPDFTNKSYRMNKKVPLIYKNCIIFYSKLNI